MTMKLQTEVCSLSYCVDKYLTTKTPHHSSALSLGTHVEISSSKLCDILHLKVQQSFLEKTQKHLFDTFKYLEPYIVKELNELYEELNQKRLQESEKLQKEVISVMQLMKSLKKCVTIDKLKEINIEEFEASLMDVENKIAALKDIFEKQSAFLSHQEQELQSYVTLIGNKIDEWSKSVKVDTVQPSTHQTAVLFNSGANYNESVNNFQKFLREEGGHTGGWDEADHLIFIRLRRKYQSEQIFFMHLQEQFPDKTVEALHEHDQWFREYEDLKTKQKQAIHDWRLSKKPLYRSVSVSDKLSVHMSSMEQQRFAICTSEYREQQKRQLEEWRVKKEAELQIKILKGKEELQKQMREEEARKKRHAIQKAEIELYKERKLKEEQAVALEKETHNEKSSCSSNKALKVFRQRDAEIMARQKETKDRLQQEQKKKEKVLEALRGKAPVQVTRDPHRLLQPTGAWREHTKLTRSADSSSSRLAVPLNVQEVPHLGIPMWRKN